MSEPEIIYENPDFIAVDKPAGLQVHPAKVRAQRPKSQRAKEPKSSYPDPTLVDWLLERYPEIKSVGDDPETRPGIVHRLDKGTSGILLIARSQKYFEYLKSLFQKHEIQKTYLALASGKLMPQSGIIDKPIGIKNGTLKRSVHSEKMAKEAVTEYQAKKYLSDSSGKVFSLVEVMPKTGRTHQIRVHLASVGHAIVGDALYGSKKKKEVVRLMLHAASLEFTTMERKRARFEAEPPEDFERVLSQLQEE